jgi:hypothetical protein
MRASGPHGGIEWDARLAETAAGYADWFADACGKAAPPK